MLNKNNKEKIIVSVPGILPQGWKARSVSFGGYGKTRAPENAFIVTNKRIIFLVVPLYGAGKIIYGTNMQMLHYWFCKKIIKRKLGELIQYNTLEQILTMNEKNFALSLSNIDKIKIKRKRITFLLKNKEKYIYLLKNKSISKDLEKVFANYLEK